jgi:hypothetical protein
MLKSNFLLVLFLFLGSGLLWGQTQENYITYEGFEYTFVDIQKGSDGYIYCVGRTLDFNSVYDFKLFVLEENLGIEYVSEQQMFGPIGLRRSGDSLLMANYNNVSHEFSISTVSYRDGGLTIDTLIDQWFIDYYMMDLLNPITFGFIQLKVISGEKVGLLVSQGSTLNPLGLEVTYSFFENPDQTLKISRLSRYNSINIPDVKVLNAFDFNIYRDSLYILRSWSSASIYDKEWNLVGGRHKQSTLYNQGFILPYGDDFLSFGRVMANSGNTFETVPILSFLDDEFNVIRVDSVWSPNKQWFGVPAWYGGLISNVENDTFFACATKGYHWFFNSGIIDTSAQIYVRAYDDQMNNLWEMVIGDSLHHISVLKMERMPNGNLMLIGSEGSPASKYKFRPLIIEIDPDGTVVSSTNPVPVQSMEVTLYPNPVGNQLFLDWKGENREVDVQIVNASGQEVQQLQALRRGSAIDVARLSSGMYYLILRKDGKILNSKPFVKGGR